MKPFRDTILTVGAAALFTLTLAVAPGTAGACEGHDGACAESCAHKAECKDGAECKATAKAATEGAAPCGKTDGSCACVKKGAAEAEPEGKPETDAGKGGAELRATIDPETGELVAPTDAEAAADAPVAVERNAGNAGANAQAVHPDGGVSAAFPANRAADAVAHRDAAGEAHSGCSHGE